MKSSSTAPTVINGLQGVKVEIVSLHEVDKEIYNPCDYAIKINDYYVTNATCKSPYVIWGIEKLHFVATSNSIIEISNSCSVVPFLLYVDLNKIINNSYTAFYSHPCETVIATFIEKHIEFVMKKRNSDGKSVYSTTYNRHGIVSLLVDKRNQGTFVSTRFKNNRMTGPEEFREGVKLYRNGGYRIKDSMRSLLCNRQTSIEFKGTDYINNERVKIINHIEPIHSPKFDALAFLPFGSFNIVLINYARFYDSEYFEKLNGKLMGLMYNIRNRFDEVCIDGSVLPDIDKKWMCNEKSKVKEFIQKAVKDRESGVKTKRLLIVRQSLISKNAGYIEHLKDSGLGITSILGLGHLNQIPQHFHSSIENIIGIEQNYSVRKLTKLHALYCNQSMKLDEFMVTLNHHAAKYECFVINKFHGFMKYEFSYNKLDDSMVFTLSKTLNLHYSNPDIDVITQFQ